MSSPPIEIGNRHDQQMSVIGLTKLPVQRPGPASAIAGVAVARPRMAASMSASFLKCVIGPSSLGGSAISLISSRRPCWRRVRAPARIPNLSVSLPPWSK